MATNTCLDCVRKHLAQAAVLLDETHLGYPHHRWLAVGNMAEAERESRQLYPAFAAKIRACRLIVMSSHENSKEDCIESLIREACVLAGEDDIVKHEDPANSKKFDFQVVSA